MPRRDNRTYKAALQAQAKVTAARQELAEEPMRRYRHPIPVPCPCPCPCPESGGEAAWQRQTLTRILEELQTQSQLLVDLTGAVNGLAAALLAGQGPAAG